MRLPSYSAAVTEPSVWELVVRCCDTSSLRNLCRVCSYINEPATRELWSNPIPRILDLPKPCVRIIYFFDHALLVRQKIRNKVRTLDLRKLGASSLMRQQCRGKHFRETCEMTINGVWVCQKLYLFPNLRFLLLDELTGFRNTVFASFGPDQEAEMSRVYPLMISAANCFSLYPIRLLTSRHLLSVLYLDLSGARANDAWRTYLVPELLPRLRVLKLRNTNLNDGNIPPILVFEATQIWSVDLRDNNFTDGIVPALIGMSANKLECRQSYEDISPDNKYDDDPPRYSQDGFDSEVLRTMQDVVSFRPDEEDTFMKYLSLHGDMLSQTPIEISDPIIRLTGLTHLYISGNRFSQYGVSSILKSKLGSRLQYLDVGSVTGTTSQLSHNPWGASKLYSQTVGVEYLARSCAMRLEVLRIHHSIITNVSSIGNPRIPPGELPYIAELRPDIIDQRVSPLSSPDTNPRIHTLILTDVPRRTRGPVIDRLKAFITACAIQEQEIATVIRANSPLTRRSPKILPGLQILRLEFQELDQKQYHINNNRSSNNLFASYGSGSSVSGDPDADEFIAQSQNDFSFFSSSSDNDRPRRTKSPPTSPSTNIPRTLAASRNVAQELQAWRLWGAGREWGGRLEMRFREYGNDEYRDVGGRVVWAGPDICVEG